MNFHITETDTERAVKLGTDFNIRLFILQKEMIEKGNLAFFKDMQDLLEKYEPPKPKATSFVVGDVFRHEDVFCVPQQYDRAFSNFVAGAAKKKMEITSFPSPTIYRLEKDMFGTEVVQATGARFMTEEEFWLVLFLLINPELGKEYLNYQISKRQYYTLIVQPENQIPYRVTIMRTDNCYFIHKYKFDNKRDQWSDTRRFLYWK